MFLQPNTDGVGIESTVATQPSTRIAPNHIRKLLEHVPNNSGLAPVAISSDHSVDPQTLILLSTTITKQVNNRIDIMHEQTSVRPMIYASMFAALTAIGALIRIPIPATPVPITLQVFFVLLAGLLLGSKWAGMSMIVYGVLGIIGFPVFSGGLSGIGVILGPTGGYIIGFIPAAFLTGLVTETFGRSMLAAISAMITGIAAIYLLGVFQLSVVAGLSVPQSVVLGVLPFLIGDSIKLVAALIVSRLAGPVIR
ncbi:MAG: biotin transporter BioY [Euryarchaeota archaeon]|nr:biotin transporter BioY [Euryarchaeota archaeon]